MNKREILAVIICMFAFILAIIPGSKSESQVLMASVRSNQSPVKAEILGDVCCLLFGTTSSSDEMEVTVANSGVFEVVVTVEDIRLNDGYQGILHTAEVNDGFRIEMGPDGSVALLVEDPASGTNAFKAISMGVAERGVESTWTIVIDTRAASRSISFGGTSLPVVERQNTCSTPEIGVGFNDERVFAGVVTVDIFERVDDYISPVIRIRSAFRWLLLLCVVFMWPVVEYERLKVMHAQMQGSR